jgi:hypothetical protein
LRSAKSCAKVVFTADVPFADFLTLSLILIILEI